MTLLVPFRGAPAPVQSAVRICLMLSLIAFGVTATASAAPLLVENFDDITTLPGDGWTLINNSAPLGTTDWFQGNSGIFPADSGAPDSYIAANFNGADFGGTVSEWLLTPVLTLNNGDVLSFAARTSTSLFNDQLEVRLSTNGGSANVGATALSVGDFTTLVASLQPLSDASWGNYAFAMSGLAGPTSGRLAFRYFVGDTSIEGDYIGLDSVAVDVGPTAIPEPSTLALLGIGLLAGARSWRRHTSRRDNG